jgi:hypothetical protein
MKPNKKKIRYFLEQFDGVWSIPLTILGFWLIGLTIQFFDVTAGSYDLAFFQPLFLAVGIVVGAVNAAIIGMYFTFRGIYRFFYGYKDENGDIINQSKEEWKGLLPWQKFAFSFFVFYFLVYQIVSVYLKLI